MSTLRRWLWMTLGLLMLGVAYVGVVTPGIPWSTPTVAAAYCFARSNRKWHDWLMNHRLFGTFLRNWQEKRIFPTRAKWIMLITMDISLILIIITTQNWWLALGVGMIMFIVCVWAWRLPGSEAEYERRQQLKSGDPDQDPQ